MLHPRCVIDIVFYRKSVFSDSREKHVHDVCSIYLAYDDNPYHYFSLLCLTECIRLCITLQPTPHLVFQCVEQLLSYRFGSPFTVLLKPYHRNLNTRNNLFLKLLCHVSYTFRSPSQFIFRFF